MKVIRSSATSGTLVVEVSKMGVSMSPSSSTWVEPVSLPKPLPTNMAPGDFLAIEITGVRQNGGHAGADVVAADDGGVSDFDAGDVGDGVEWAGREDADLQAQVGGAGPWVGSYVLRGSERWDQ